MKMTNNVFSALQAEQLNDEDFELLAYLFGTTLDKDIYYSRLSKSMTEATGESNKRRLALIEQCKGIPEVIEAARMINEVDDLALTLSYIRDAAQESVEKTDNLEASFRTFIEAIDHVACKFEDLFRRLEKQETNITDLINGR